MRSERIESDCVSEITPELMVYRYSAEKALNFCRKKVAIMAESATFEISRSLVRSAAKGGLMEDGKDELLQCQYCTELATTYGILMGSIQWLV